MKAIRATILAACVTVLCSGIASAASSPFTGSWDSTDLDGSYQVMAISGVAPDGSARVTLFDAFGTICVTVGASSTSFHGLAEASVDDAVLQFTWRHVGCGDVEAFYELGGGTLIYVTATDQIVDGAGVVWSRIGGR
jgi:hypothetical protein